MKLDKSLLYGIHNTAMLAVITDILVEIMEEEDSIFSSISKERVSDIIISDLKKGIGSVEVKK